MSRKQLTAALFVALGATAATSCFAATATAVTVDAGRLGKASAVQMASRLDLGNGASYKATHASVITRRGTVKTRERQTFNGVPVYGRDLVVERDSNGNVLSMRGKAERGLAADIASVVPRKTPAQAQQALKSVLGVSPTRSISNAQSELFVLPGKAGSRARLVYLTSFVVGGASNASRPFAIVDANTGAIIEQWEGLTHGRLPPPNASTAVPVQASGVGGNATTGAFVYDGSAEGYPLLDVQRVGQTCYMQNDLVATYTVAGGLAGVGGVNKPVLWSFGCANAPYVSSGDSVNGATSAINDAHHFAGVVYDMYSTWFDGEVPLINDDGTPMKMQMIVHAGVNWVNAYWDGDGMVYGDGDGVNYFPLTTLDVTAHEASHGFTEHHSGLRYSGQSGGMNEAFSDMAGESAEFFDRGSNDFLLGADIIIPGTVDSGDLNAFRDMCTPSRDGNSIDTADDYTDGLDVHYSSGVYNRAFCLLAKTEGWNTRQAFEVFHDANAVAWQSDETFDGGACGVEQAATDRGYDAADVTAAFATVKVVCDETP